jgi:uncharacterized membrane protein YeaQ/YmgE (transglycosylase-associated protein family)
MPTAVQLIVWIIVGLLAGSLTSRLITWDRVGFGRWRNLGLGLIGALVGGLLFRLFGWWPNLDLISVSLRDIVAAVIGSFIVLGALWLYQRSLAN